MNTTKTKSNFSSRLAKIVVLMALLVCSLPSLAYDFEVIYREKPVYFNIIGGDEVCITYKDTTYNSYDGNYTDEDADFFDMQVEKYRCMSIPSTITYDNKTYRVTAIGENAFRDCTKIQKISWKGEPIRVIGAYAFKGCSNLRYIYLPRVLEAIDAHAFEDCTCLHYVEFPESVATIGEYAFQNCTSLKWMYLKSPMTISKGAFHNANLKGHNYSEGVAIFCTITTPPIIADSTAFDENHYANSLVSVLHSFENVFRADDNWNRFSRYAHLIYDFQADNLFYRIDNDSEVSIVTPVLYRDLGNVDIPPTVEFLGHTYTVARIEDAGLRGLVGDIITIPNTVKYVGAMAFFQSEINKVVFGDSVESIGYGAFNKSRVREVYIPKSVKEIGDSVFLNTPDLEYITIEDGNPIYDSREGCNALIHSATNRLIAGSGGCTVIPSSVSSITDMAFYGNQCLKEVTIPNSISRIGKGVFMGCGNLTKINFSDSLKSIGMGAFELNTRLASVIIPSSVDTIEGGAFQVCPSLRSITLGSGLKYIGSAAFSIGFESLIYSSVDSVICYATTPPVMENDICFYGAYERATLFVPQASLELYKNDTNWSQFYKIVAIESSGIDEIPVDNGAPRVRYNLQGQPVGDDYRGIVIENGKKILVE